MSTDEKFENAKDKLGGQAKEGLGKLTGEIGRASCRERV